MKRLLEWCLVTSALTAFPAMASGSASIVCKNTYPVMEVTYSTDGDAAAPGLFWFGVEKSDLSQGAYYDINNTWQIYVGGLYPPNQIYLSGLPGTIGFEVPPPNGSHNTSAYVGWGVYGGHGVYTVPAQADVATRENMLVQNQSRMQANGTWGSEYEAVNDGQKMAWAETQKNSVDYNKYALLLTIPLVYCASPVAEADSFSVYAGHSGSYGVPLVNDYDPESLSFGIVGISTPSHGTLSYSGSTFTYTPNAGFWGTDSYTYTIQNSAGLEASATDVVTVVALPPVAVGDSASMNTNGSASFNALLNDSDPNGFTLSIASLGGAAHGSVSNSGGTVTYTPNGGFYGSDSFTYTIQNSAGLTAAATESMTVTARAPVALADSSSSSTNASATFNVLGNDSDPQGLGLIIVSAGPAAHGSVSSSGANITFSPAANWWGTDTFPYTIRNAAGLTASAIETVTTNARPPVALSDSSSTSAGNGTTFNALGNDSDPQGLGLTIVSAGPAAHGSLSVGGANVTYTPNTGWWGTDTFPYTIRNAAGLTASATETVNVSAPVYPAPTGSLAANPTSVTSSSQSITLNWNCTNSSSATPLNFSGGSGTTGSATVTESATTTWQLRCNGLNGTNFTPTATVTYSAPSVPPPDMWIGVMDLDQNAYTGNQHGVAVVGNTQLYLDYGCGDQGMKTHASDPSLFTWSSDTFDVNSPGRLLIDWPGYEILITISQRTTFTITCTRKSDGGTITGMVTLNWTAPPE